MWTVHIVLRGKQRKKRGGEEERERDSIQNQKEKQKLRWACNISGSMYCILYIPREGTKGI